MDASLDALIKAHAPFLVPTPEGKVECTLNGHTFPSNAAQIEAFVSGKKYKKLKERKEAELALRKYEPFLMPSVNFPEMVFCALTNELVVKSEQAIKVHMGGKKFQKAQALFQEDGLELAEEPTAAELEAAEQADTEAAAADAADAEVAAAEAGGAQGIWVPEAVLAEEAGAPVARAQDESMEEDSEQDAAPLPPAAKKQQPKMSKGGGAKGTAGAAAEATRKKHPAVPQRGGQAAKKRRAK